MEMVREFRILNGQYEGIHKVYWNAQICMNNEHIKQIKRWGIDKEIEVGEWVESLDGSCCQLLAKRTYKDNKDREHTFHRFPMATITTYYSMKGIWKCNNFYASLTIRHSNLSMNINNANSHQRTRFVTYIISGINPLRAYRLAFNNRSTMSIASLHRKVTKMILDPDTQKEMKEQLVPFIEQIGEKFTDISLVRELELLLQASRKGSDAHRENIKFIMALLNKLPQAMYPGSKAQKSLAQEVQVISPPQLGQIEQ